jgi:AraC family L-rhamnose operon transcriptional activator RhaR
MGRNAHPVKTGSLLLIPPGVHHSFAETEGRRPLCLAIDIVWRRSRPKKTIISQLTSLELGGVRNSLSALTRWREGHETVEPREAAAVLQLIDIFFRSLGLLARTPDAAQHSVVRTVQRALNDPAMADLTLAALAGRIGYQKDYLNRLLKQSHGMSLGQMRAAQRVEQAKKLLSGGGSVAEAAFGVGFEDPNYFARWFRKLTGLAPSDWRKH